MDFDMDAIQGYVSEDGEKNIMNLKFGTSTSVAAEGAYFFNKYIGIGGRLRVNSSPIKGWDKIIDYGWQDLAYAYEAVDSEGDKEFASMVEKMFDDVDFVIESDHLTEFTADLGAYFNLPISKRFALGSKLLIGRSIVTELDIMIETLKKRFFALVQKTLIVALKDAQNRYLMIYPDKRPVLK